MNYFIKDKTIGLPISLLGGFVLMGFISLIYMPQAVAESNPSQASPKIEINQSLWDFGEIGEGGVFEHKFIVKNSGKEDLIIDEIRSGCPCLSAEISSMKIPPGGSAELEVLYNTKGKKLGPDKKGVMIISNDLSQAVKTVYVSAIIKQKNDSSQDEKGSLGITAITSEELFKKLEDKEKIVLLDVREKNEYLERHIAGAVFFPKSRFDKNDKTLKNKLKKISKNTVIVTYCGAGHRSSYVAKKLIESGYNAFNLDGISFWEKKGYPVVRGPKSPPFKEPLTIHLEEAYEHYFKLFKDVVWVDVRDEAEYKKGHIKDAVNIPLSKLEEKLDLIPKDKEIVIYCEGISGIGKCESSMSAGRILIERGFRQGLVKVFEDGFNAWKNTNYPIGF